MWKICARSRTKWMETRTSIYRFTDFYYWLLYFVWIIDRIKCIYICLFWFFFLLVCQKPRRTTVRIEEDEYMVKNPHLNDFLFHRMFVKFNYLFWFKKSINLGEGPYLVPEIPKLFSFYSQTTLNMMFLLNFL